MKRYTKLTETSYKLYKECKRCFYLSYKFGIERPSKSKRVVVESPELDEELSKEIKKTISKGAPLHSPTCPFCVYRHLVRETGLENELTA